MALSYVTYTANGSTNQFDVTFSYIEQSHVKVYIDNVCDLLNKVGININTVPVLDVFNKKNKTFIGCRSFSKNQKVVSKLG